MFCDLLVFTMCAFCAPFAVGSLFNIAYPSWSDSE